MREARRSAVAVVLPAFVAGLLAAPAVAKKTPYSGYLNPPQVGYVSFKVESHRKKGKLRPVAVRKVGFSVDFHCSDAAGGDVPFRSTSVGDSGRIPLRNREFASSLTSSLGLTYVTRGRVPRRGPATGTVSVTGSDGDVTCNVTLPWTANVDTSGY
jgi:hypothetical protein